MQLRVVNLRHRYTGQPVLRGLDLALESGEVGCLLGPSGCGKTTALRCIAGFEPVDEGEIAVGGVTLSRPGFTEAPERRKIGMVFQEAALLPHLTATENVAFGLHHLTPAERALRSAEYLEMVGLGGSAGKYPHELSGGQQQRVALARALAPEPRLILLDEPFANLDVFLRERLGRDVRDVLNKTGVTALLVTHDQYEAFMLADRIGVMLDGVLAQWGTPHDLYHRPVDRRVAAFIGSGVFVDGEVLSAGSIRIAGETVRGEVDPRFATGAVADVLLRPDDVIEDPAGMPAVVERTDFRGATIKYALRLESGDGVLASLPADTAYEVGQTIRVTIAPAHLVLFRRRDD